MRLGYHPEPGWWNHLIDGWQALVLRLERLAEDIHDKFPHW